MFFDDVIEEEYAKRTFTEKDKKFITDLIDEIIEYYKNDINSLKWMTKETKEKAIFKLNNIKINVGLVNNEIYSDKYKLKEKDNLFNNTLSIINYTYNRNLSYLKDPSKDASLMNTYTVNAYYSPQDNSINFPCASIKFKTSDNYFESLGELGMVIAHEITHAFDNNGRMFNEKGEYYDWWAKQDSENFEKLSNNIVDYYSKYTVLGINVDGKRTLGENIADLGSIKCITSLAEKHNAKNEDYKRMYEHFAKWSAMNYNDQMTKLLVTSDTHSPNNVRVNATLSSTNKFYEVYNIKKNDKMYKNENERVGIW
jgi:putative endopeptidase